MDLLIKYASRGRPHLLHDRIRNIYQTSEEKDFRIILSIDENDALTTDPHFINSLLSISDEKLIIKTGKSLNKIHAINRDLEIAYDWDWKWLINFSDDMVFTTYGWDRLMKQDIKSVWGESTDFFAHFNDGHVGSKLPTMSVIGRDYFERTHRIYSPAYKAVSCDAEEMYIAMMIGKHHYFDTVYFKHIHPANGYMNDDNTYRMNNRFGDDDTKTYFKRLSKCFYVHKPLIIPNEIRQFVSNIDSYDSGS